MKNKQNLTQQHLEKKDHLTEFNPQQFKKLTFLFNALITGYSVKVNMKYYAICYFKTMQTLSYY